MLGRWSDPCAKASNPAPGRWENKISMFVALFGLLDGLLGGGVGLSVSCVGLGFGSELSASSMRLGSVLSASSSVISSDSLLIASRASAPEWRD